MVRNVELLIGEMAEVEWYRKNAIKTNENIGYFFVCINSNNQTSLNLSKVVV